MALLSRPDWNGTLAATRALGRAHVPVHVAGPSVITISGSSRFAGRRLHCPPLARPGEHLRWLLALGKAHPRRYALCPTSDDSAWLYAAHAEELAPLFLQSPPPLSALRLLLDKSRLTQGATAVGLRTPATWFPADAGEAARIAEGARFPLLIKQRAQVFSSTNSKGAVVSGPGEVAEAWTRFRARNRFAGEVLERWPGLDLPMLQEFLPVAAERIYCLSGFLAKDGARHALRASLKVLSHPRRLGIGVCFEHEEVDPALAQAVLELCRRAGFHGAFQCEFLEQGGERLLIDFNPRFYNFMSFDQARGLPQAELSYLDACGDEAAFDLTLLQAAQVTAGAAAMVWCDRIGLRQMLLVEGVLGVCGREERRRWRGWLARAQVVIDAQGETGDRRPVLAGWFARLRGALRHPRGFIAGHLGRV